MIESLKLSLTSTVEDALKIIDSGAMKIGLVVDKKNKLIGTVSDGDVRRGLLKGIGLGDSIELIVHTDPVVSYETDTKDKIIKHAISNNVYQVPIINSDKVLVGIEDVKTWAVPEKKTNKIVLMVGGLGSRLMPLTKDKPKPMLNVGNKPILQTIVEKFASYGFTEITMCVNYKSELIRDYFGDGTDFGVDIEYLIEDKRLGTAGALSLLKSNIQEPFFVMNGDLLTNVNFEHLLEFHQSSKAAATMCVREYDFQVPYGVVNIQKDRITSIEEKPVQKFFVNAGIYMLEPMCLDFIPKNQFFDMPVLFTELIQSGLTTTSFPIREYWLDIGRIEEYDRANTEFGNVF